MKKLFNWLSRLTEIPKPSIRKTTQHPYIYPKNPKYNGNFCAGMDGVNIYDYLDDNGKIDWDAHKEDVRKVEEYNCKIWDYSDN